MASPPLYMTPVPAADVTRGDGTIVTKFVQSYCRITKESWGGHAGDLLAMRQWQQNLAACVYARRPDGRLRHRQALIGLPRKQGKSALGSSFGLYGLIAGAPGSEVYSAAVDKEQARVVFNVAKRMVQLDPDLNRILTVQRDGIIYEEKGSIYKVLSSEAITKEGLNPTTVIYDEIHGAPTPELYDVMTLAMGARHDPLLIAITTAGVKYDKTGRDSTCYKMYHRGIRICKGEENDASFFMAWWGAPDGADYRDPRVWEAANPGYGDLIDPEDFAFSLSSVHENEFRALDVNTPLLTANRGWITIGTVQIGDIVFSGNGDQTEVVGTSDVFTGRKCYEVELDDGRKIIADAQHEWHVLERNKSNNLERLTVTTEELMPIASRKRYIEPPKHLDLPEASLPIDPYIFGYWLGDGSKTHPVISSHADDLPSLTGEVKRAGYHCTVKQSPTCARVYISCSPIVYGTNYYCEACKAEFKPTQWRQRTCGRICGAILRKMPGYIPTSKLVVKKETLRRRLIDLGVKGNKHIPEQYLLASDKQRLALLQGLMDSDGTVTAEGSARFCNTNRDLVDGVLFLARSFGWIARVREIKTGHAQTWVVSWAIAGIRIPFRLPRKADKVKRVSGNYIRTVASKVIHVNEVASRPTRCLAVKDSSHTFLAGRDLSRSTNTKRLNQFVSAQQAWLPAGAWQECRSDRDFTPGARGVVLGFDGSRNQDTTALVAVTVDSEPQIIVLGAWEKPDPKIDPNWQVPRGAVKDAIRHACQDYNVREVACDEYIWTDALEELKSEGIPILVFPQHLSKMGPATQRMYEMVVHHKVSHDGNPTLARHFDNVELKTDARGSRIQKASKNSSHKIDLALATVMAIDRAAFWYQEPLEGTIGGMPVSNIQFVWGDGPMGDRPTAGEKCVRCGNKVVRELKRVGVQVVCAVPCTAAYNPMPDDSSPPEPDIHVG